MSSYLLYNRTVCAVAILMLCCHIYIHTYIHTNNQRRCAGCSVCRVLVGLTYIMNRLLLSVKEGGQFDLCTCVYAVAH